ncbi:unnamed protein product [Rotaria socialis]|uniref:Saposin B-type domain-containing protein n=1 Tax=Rotaria socialis TaxID=392032 RepID=A0A818ALJ6_9BILA|nr:unnamed protein product [Rotaria socialis]CAF4609363.1 unnamed protein product [Rotaria socialis]
MFKQVVLFLSLIQLMHGLSLRSNIWWSRRSESSLPDCDVAFDNESPSLEAKICGYCFASCQQQLATCLLAQIKESLNASLEDCQEKCEQCEKRCLTDKRTSRIAAENWAKVVAVLRQFNSYWPVKEEQTQSTEP